MSPVERFYDEFQIYDGAVSIPAYANILGISECGLWGVVPPNNERSQCKTVWTKRERDILARYLSEAQEEIEREIGFFLQPKWVVGTLAEQASGDPRYVEDTKWYRAGHQRTKWTNIIAGGIKATSDISLGKAPDDKSIDPMVFSAIATTVTDIDEVYVYHPGTDIPIIPSSIEISGGIMTIEIPRCRLVTEAASTSSESGISYSTLTNFEDTVDIKRVYNDPSTNAVLVAPHNCTASCSVNGCSEYTHDACIYVRDPVLGIVDILPGSYSGGSWTSTVTSCCYNYTRARLYYQSGLVRITREAQEAVIHLAHTKISREPCQCEVTGKAWKDDNEIPAVQTAETINCKFGKKYGAWLAYQFTLAQKVVRGGMSL